MSEKLREAIDNDLVYDLVIAFQKDNNATGEFTSLLGGGLFKCKDYWFNFDKSLGLAILFFTDDTKLDETKYRRDEDKCVETGMLWWKTTDISVVSVDLLTVDDYELLNEWLISRVYRKNNQILHGLSPSKADITNLISQYNRK